MKNLPLGYELDNKQIKEQNMNSKTPIQFLQDAISLQEKKSRDYQNPNSSIVQADYYPRGCETILDIMHAKLLRMRSVIEAMRYDEEYTPNFESLQDSSIDLINYTSFFAAYISNGINGQSEDRDFLNRKK